MAATQRLGILALLLLAVHTSATPVRVGVFVTADGTLKALPCDDSGLCLTAAATAAYSNLSLTTGWSRLVVDSNPLYDDILQAQAAGYAEGFVTYSSMLQAKTNLFDSVFGRGGNPSTNLTSFFEQQLLFVRQESQAGFASGDEYWRQMYILMAQFDGLLWGYNNASSTPMSELDLYIVNSAGDLEDLSGLFKEIHSPLRHYDPATEMDCSALIKLTATDLMVGHTTWRGYANMAPRTFKWYNLGFLANSLRVTFSSTPGFLTSKDDYYVVASQKMAVMETTNSVFNQSLYSNYLTPKSCFCWQRTFVANVLASNGEEWVTIFAKYNSGTYNNQWMVVDYKKDITARPLPAGTLWILEQIPGFTQQADVTSVLSKQMYWPSYNIPYFPEIFNMSGYNTRDPADYGYDTCPRAQLFRQLHQNISDIKGMQFVMQYNDITNPLQRGTFTNAISSRYDLDPNRPDAFGGIDSKVADSAMISAPTSMAISGPTQQQQPFSWENPLWNGITHQGAPTLFNFSWQYLEHP